MLYASYRDLYTLTGRVGYDFKCEYDKNWNIIKFTTSYLELRYTETNFYYTSYDNEGNWTQCIAVYKDNENTKDIYKLTRDITYW